MGEAEGIVQDALDVAMKGRTTLVIAHRLSTIKTASQIVCMRDGKIVEYGTPRELLQRQGYYWSLVRRQVCTLDEISDVNLELDQQALGAVATVATAAAAVVTQDKEESAGAADGVEHGLADGLDYVDEGTADGVGDGLGDGVVDDDTSADD